MTTEEADALRLSLLAAGVAVVAMFPVAFALGWALERWRFPGRIALEILVDLPIVLPPVVTGWALLVLFGHGGPLEVIGGWFVFRWTGAALAAGLIALPFMVRALRLGLGAVDRAHEEAARGLGADRWQVLRTITLPLALPGVLAALVLGFAKALGEFGATITFVASIPGETRTLPLAIYGALQRPGGETMVARLSLMSVALSIIALAGAEWAGRAARRRARGVG